MTLFALHFAKKFHSNFWKFPVSKTSLSIISRKKKDNLARDTKTSGNFSPRISALCDFPFESSGFFGWMESRPKLSNKWSFLVISCREIYVTWYKIRNNLNLLEERNSHTGITNYSNLMFIIILKSIFLNLINLTVWIIANSRWSTWHQFKTAPIFHMGWNFEISIRRNFFNTVNLLFST